MNYNLINRILEGEDIRSLIELSIVRDTYQELKSLARKNYQRCPVGKWNNSDPVSIDVYDRPLRIAFTFFNADDNLARKWIESFCDKQNIIIDNVTKAEKSVHYDIKISDFSPKTEPLDGVNSIFTVICGMEQPKQEVASKSL